MTDTRIRNVAAKFFIVRYTDSDELVDEQGYLDRAINFVSAYDDLTERLSSLEEEVPEVDIQTIFYDIGKEYYGVEQKILLEWFKDIYAVLTGKDNGPRIGTFVHIYGIGDFITSMDQQMNDPFDLAGMHRKIKEWIEGHPEAVNGCSFTEKEYNLWKKK